MKKSLDVLILFALVIARIRLDTLADVAALPQRHQDVRRLVEGWWPAWSLDRLAHPETDPITTLLIVASLGLLCLYLILDTFSTPHPPSTTTSPLPARRGSETHAPPLIETHPAEPRLKFWAHPQTTHRLKLILIYSIIGCLVFAKTILLIQLRHLSGPVSYAHDGGVIQTEITIDYFLRGLNPYVENYVNTPMAEWGFPEYRTALYHYPYLPWTFIFSAPFYLLSQALVGWFDQRWVYLLLFALTLLLTQALVPKPQEKLIAVALVGLNPIMAISLIFGENDPFVLFWIVLALWLIQPGQARITLRPALLGSAAFGLACASKPTAWFLAPFWLLYLLRDQWADNIRVASASLKTLISRAWTLPVVSGLVILPWLIWQPAAFYDDVWRWSAGQGTTGYQIWGWGASNLLLALGWVEDRFAYWPFIIPELLIGLPLLWFLLRRQLHHNTAGTMLYSYVLLLFAFFYVSRFLQPNYLGYLLSLLTLSLFIDEKRP